MHPTRGQWMALAASLCLTVFTVLASYIFLWATDLLVFFPYSWMWRWWEYLWMYPNDPTVSWYLIVSGIPAALVPLVLFGLTCRRWRHIQGWFMIMHHTPTQPWSRHEPTQSHGNAAFVRDAASKMRK